MKNLFALILCLFTSTESLGQTYVTNTTIIDVENQKLVPNQTVVITNDKISNIQSIEKIKIPANTTVVYHIENGEIQKMYFVK